MFVDIKDLNLDNDDVQAWDGGGVDLPEPGDYMLEVVSAEVSNSKAGNRVLVETTKIVSNADGSKTTQAGKQVKQWRALTQSAAARFKHYRNVVGLELRNGGFDSDTLKGRRYAATITLEPYTRMKDDGSEQEFLNPKVSKERRVATAQ